MSGKVVSLRGGAVPQPQAEEAFKPDPELVEIVEALLAGVKDGSVKAVALATVEHGLATTQIFPGEYEHGLCSAVSDLWFRMFSERDDSAG